MGIAQRECDALERTGVGVGDLRPVLKRDAGGHRGRIQDGLLEDDDILSRNQRAVER